MLYNVPWCFPELIWPEYRILHDCQSNKCSRCLVTWESDPGPCITNPIILSLANPVSRLEWCACCYLCVKSSLLCLCLHDSDQTHVWECWLCELFVFQSKTAIFHYQLNSCIERLHIDCIPLSPLYHDVRSCLEDEWKWSIVDWKTQAQTGWCFVGLLTSSCELVPINKPSKWRLLIIVARLWCALTSRTEHKHLC